MKLKKIFICAALASLILVLGACSGGTSSSNNAASGSAGSASVQAANQNPTIQETVLLDDAGVKITATNFDSKASLGATVKLLIENNSGQDLIVQARNSSVNGYMVDTMLSCSIADGKKANDTLVFARSDLNLSGIQTVASMQFSFHIFTQDGWSAYLDSALITLETSAAENYEYAFPESGQKVFDAQGIAIFVRELSDNASNLGPSIVVEIINSTDRNYTVQARDVAVNGFMVDPVFSRDVGAGKHAIDTVAFMKSALSDNDIQSIDEVSLSFHVFNWDNWMESIDSDTITLSF